LLPDHYSFPGIGDVSKIFLISLNSFPGAVIARDASRNIAAEYVLSLRSLGASLPDIQICSIFQPACRRL
jgi:hypothetical protein